MKHSPGPWRWEAGDDEVDRLVDTNGREVVCGWAQGRHGYLSCSEQDANLIALAPQMAEMLRELYEAGDIPDDTYLHRLAALLKALP